MIQEEENATSSASQKSASVPEFAGFPHPAAPWLPTRCFQVCVVCHLHTEGAVTDPAGGWYSPAEKLDLKHSR